MAANRQLVKTDAGWRFLSSREASPAGEKFAWSLAPVTVTVDDNAHTVWKRTAESNILLYTHPPVDGIAADSVYSTAMTEAMNALFREELFPSEGAP